MFKPSISVHQLSSCCSPVLWEQNLCYPIAPRRPSCCTPRGKKEKKALLTTEEEPSYRGEAELEVVGQKGSPLQFQKKWLCSRSRFNRRSSRQSPLHKIMPGTAASLSLPCDTHTQTLSVSVGVVTLTLWLAAVAHLSLRLASDAWLSLCKMSTKPISLSLSWRSWEPDSKVKEGYSSMHWSTHVYSLDFTYSRAELSFQTFPLEIRIKWHFELCNVWIVSI